jgi:O-antigen ligase
MWWFVGYLGVYLVNLPRVPSEFLAEFLVRLVTMVQLLSFFWIASDLLKNEKMVRHVLLTYSIACAIFAIGIVLNVPGFSQEITTGRVTALGENLNLVARFMAIAIIVLMYLSTSAVYTRFQKRVFLLLSLPVLVAMIGTGSRGAVVALIIGVCVFLVPFCQTKRGFTTVILALLGIGSIVYLIANSPAFTARWEDSYYEGDLSQREVIFSVAKEMISERPLFGWGPIEAGYILGDREGTVDWVDAHNVFLHLLVEVGIVGTIPFLIGLCLCIRSAWQARLLSLGLLPLALTVMTLVGGLAANTTLWKSQWLILALTMSASNPRKFKKRYFAVARGPGGSTSTAKSSMRALPADTARK